MMRRPLFILPLVILSALAAVPARPSAPAPQTDIRTLSSGMRLICLPDHAQPLVAAQVLVKVGSVNEDEATIGLSHFLEHLCFKGTPAYTAERLTDAVEALGGYVNAATWQDGTSYEIAVPRRFWRAGLGVQAEMLLHSTFPLDEFDRERNVVIEELRRDLDDPETQLGERIDALAFAGTPYAHNVIGTPESLQRALRDTVIAYYRAHYRPDRMTAVVAGDIVPDEVAAQLEVLYPRPTGDPPALATTSAFVFPHGRQSAVIEYESPNPILQVAYPAPSAADQAAPAMELFARLLGGGDDARLARTLVQGDHAFATSATASYDTYAGVTHLLITVNLVSATDMRTALATVREEVGRLARDGPSDDELQRTRTARLAERAFLQQNYIYRSFFAAIGEATTGFEAYQQFEAAVPRVSRSQVQRAATRFLVRGDEVAVGLVAPGTDKPDLTAPATALPLAAVPSAGAALPDLKALPPAKGQRRLSRSTPDGLTLVVQEDPQTPVSAVVILAGHRAQLEAGHAGLGRLTQQMLDAGTTTRNREQLAAALSAIGARLTTADSFGGFGAAYDDSERLVTRLEVLADKTERGITLLADVLRDPAFPAAELETIRARAAVDQRAYKESAPGASAQALAEGVYPRDHPYRALPFGTAETITGATRQQLVDFHRRAYEPRNLTIVAVTPRDGDALLTFLAQQFAFPRPAARDRLPDAPGVPAPSAGRGERTVNREQASLRVAFVTAAATTPDAQALRVLNEVLDRRLWDGVRETKGLAYSVSARLQWYPGFGILEINLGCKPDLVETALAAVEAEVQRFIAEPPSADEIARTVNRYEGDLLRANQFRARWAYRLGFDAALGLPAQTTEQFVATLRAVSPDALRRVAGQTLDLDHAVVAVATRPQ